MLGGVERPSTMTDAYPGPRLVLEPSEWANLPDKLRDPYFQRIAATNDAAIRLNENWLREDSSSVVGPGGSDEVLDERLIRALLERTAVGYHLERADAAAGERHLTRLRWLVELVCDRRRWTIRWAKESLKHFGLKKSALAFCAAFALDVFGEELGAATRQRLVTLIEEEVFTEYVAGIEANEWWARCDHNWGSTVHGYVGFAALAVEPYLPERATDILTRCRYGLRFVIDAIPEGGGWGEGAMYLVTAFGPITYLARALHRLSGDDLGLSENRRFLDMLSFRKHVIGGDNRPLNLSDANEDTAEWCFPGAFYWAHRLRRPDLTEFENRHVKPFDSRGLYHDVQAFWFREAFQSAEPAPLEALRHFRGLDWLFWHGERTWLAFRGGCNGGNHNNLDLGHFIFGAGEDRFLVDPGWGASETNQHNAVTVHDCSQVKGAQAPIIRCWQFERGFYLACDLAQAYPFQLSHYCRHVLLVDDCHLLVLDDLLGARGGRPSPKYFLQTRLAHQFSPDCLTLSGTKETLRVRFPLSTRRLAEHAWERRGLPLTTLSFAGATGAARVRHAMLMSLDERPVEFRLEGDIATLESEGRTFRIDLAEATLLPVAARESAGRGALEAG
jgi:hypothetical protein